MAFARTIARSLWASRKTTASAATLPKPPPPIPSSRRPLPAVDDCLTLSYLRPHAATGRYSTASVLRLPPHCFPALPVGDHLFNRLRLDGLVPPTTTSAPTEASVSIVEARKVVRAAEMEAARTRLRTNAKSIVSGSEFAALCMDITSGAERARRLARALDEAGAVIVLGDIVFLRPDMVAKAIEGIIPGTRAQESNARERELRKMEEQKAAIDSQAAAQVRRELWCGLGLLTLQTLGFMRLTFWELSWDVMEPVCYYVASFYFMAGYAFFMRTAREPSFKGWFQSRFASRQRRLMQARHFDVDRYNALKQAGGGAISPRSDRHECDRNVFSHVMHAH